MTLRTMLGIGWSILCGLAGGWLVLMPWALDVQGSGDWTDLTKGAFWTGLCLLAVAVIGLIVTIGMIMRALAPARPPQEKQTAEPAADQAELDRALLQIASKLAADLNAPASQPNGPANGQPSGPTNGQPNGHVPTGVPAANGAPLSDDSVLTHRGSQS